MLNRFHVWFPGGIVVGSLLAYLMMDIMNLNWQVFIGVLFIPIALYGVLLLGQKIPETERVTSGVTYREMLAAIGAPVTLIISMTLIILLAIDVLSFPEGWMYLALIGLVLVVSLLEAGIIRKASVIFPIIFTFMMLTAATELVTNQWVNALLADAGISAMLILALISGIMALGRYFAGNLVYWLHPVGLLLLSAIFSALGIYTLSLVSMPVLTILGAIFFAIGICYFWPTMLGFCAEYIPRSGALGLSLLGGAGFASVAMFLPVMGQIMEATNTQVALQSIGILPVILIIGFSILFAVYRRRKPVEI